MILTGLQRKLENIYRLNPNPQVERFLVSSRQVRKILPNKKKPGPQVLVKQGKDEISLAVHVGDETLARIQTEGLENATLSDFCSAAEEVSHFTYLSWSVQNERSVSLLDLEIQGEIDKFLLVSTHFGLGEKLFSVLFENVQYDRTKNAVEKERYQEANRLAAKFLKSLGAWTESLRRLREFYRLSSSSRIAQLAQL